MADSRYRMQIVDTMTGEVVSYNPGGQVEKDFITDCVERCYAAIAEMPPIDLNSFIDSTVDCVKHRRVGIFAPANTVLQSVRDGMREAIVTGGLDRQTLQFKEAFNSVIRKSLEASIFELKSRINP